MGAFIIFTVVITAVVVFDLLALSRGVDSRPGFGSSRISDRVFPA